MDNNDTNEPPLFAGTEIASVGPRTMRKAVPAAARKHRGASALAAAGAKQRRDADAIAILVGASAVALHPALGIDAAAFVASHGALIDDLADEMRRGARPTARPHVVLEAGRYLAIDQVELVVAAGVAVHHSPDMMLPVLLVDALDPSRLVREQLTGARGKSGWEQRCALAAVFAAGSVREVLRELDLKLSWESTVSRVLKLGRLDPVVLEAVDPFTIPVREGGQLVDAWRDESRREAMIGVLATLRGESNQRLDAKRCFTAMLAVGRPEVIEPTWVDGEDGRRDYVAADGTVLATVSVADGRWSAAGAAMTAAHWQAFGKQMPRPEAKR